MRRFSLSVRFGRPLIALAAFKAAGGLRCSGRDLGSAKTSGLLASAPRTAIALSIPGRGLRLIGERATKQPASERPPRRPTPKAPTTHLAPRKIDGLPLLGDFPPLAARWSSRQRNKLRSPDHTPLSSTYKVKWECESCGQQYSQRVRDYVASEGACPRCNEKPALTAQQRRLLFPGSKGTRSVIVGDVELEESAPAASPASGSVAKSAAVSSVVEGGKARLLNPELALKWESGTRLIGDADVLYASPKLDGIRCIALRSAATDQPAFVTRQGTPLECCDHLAPEFTKLFQQDPNAVVDGELYTHDLNRDFEELTGAVRVTRTKRSDEQRELQRTLQYNAFDLMYASALPDDGQAPFEERQEELQRLFRAANVGPKVAIVPQKRLFKKDVEAEFRKALHEGYEGLMIRRADSPYAFGKRTNNLLKVKEFQDAEYKIVGFEEGLGRLKNHLGSFVCEVQPDSSTATPTPKIVGSEGATAAGAPATQFRATPKCNDEKKKLLWKNRNRYRGKMLTVTYQNLTKQGVPRFPIAKAVRGLASGEDWL